MLIKLTDRVVLKIFCESIEEILKFLQQITSNDLLNNESNLIYTLFLSGSGKFLFDGFIFHDDQFFYLDCFDEIKDQLISHIAKYKARLNIKIEETQYFVYQNFDENINLSDKHSFIFKDQRCDNLGERIYSINEIANYSPDINKYHESRIKNNIPEGCYEAIHDRSFPIYFKMHEINAISLKKGCYLGQEPTNRLYRTGILRKEIAPFFLNEKNLSLTKGDKLNNDIVCSIFNNQFGFLMREKEDFNLDKL